MTYGGKKARRRDVVVQLDRHTGEAVARRCASAWVVAGDGWRVLRFGVTALP